jgi:RNA polymerase sigma-70 factor (family 1)
MDLLHKHNNPELLQGIISRDKEAFPVLVNTYFPVLCSFAFSITKDHNLSKDIVQEVFLRFWKGTEKFDEFNSLKAWLYQVTRTRSLNELRSRHRLEHHHSTAQTNADLSDENVLAAIVRSETLASIYAVINELPDQMRTVFEMHFRQGMRIRDIASTLGISPKTVSNHRYNAISIVKKKLVDQPDAFILFCLMANTASAGLESILESHATLPLH